MTSPVSRRGAGLGFAEDIPDCAFAASKIASLRDIERANPGFLAEVKAVYAQGPGILPDPETSVPIQQLASALLATEPTFLEDELAPIMVCYLNFRASEDARAWLNAIRPNLASGGISHRAHARTAPLGIHMQKCPLDRNLTNNTYNRLVECLVEMMRICTTCGGNRII